MNDRLQQEVDKRREILDAVRSLRLTLNDDGVSPQVRVERATMLVDELLEIHGSSSH